MVLIQKIHFVPKVHFLPKESVTGTNFCHREICFSSQKISFEHELFKLQYKMTAHTDKPIKKPKISIFAKKEQNYKSNPKKNVSQWSII
jgi:hypothetical protein